MRSKVASILALVALVVITERPTWRTYYAHRWHRHYLWDASVAEILVHVGIPLVVVSAVVLRLVWKARSRAAAARESLGSDRSRHSLEESAQLRP